MVENYFGLVVFVRGGDFGSAAVCGESPSREPWRSMSHLWGERLTVASDISMGGRCSRAGSSGCSLVFSFAARPNKPGAAESITATFVMRGFSRWIRRPLVCEPEVAACSPVVS